MYSKTGAGSARKQEMKRQADVRQGIAQVNSIFSGTRGANAIDKASTFDPAASYYDQYGQVWTPTLGKPSWSDMMDYKAYVNSLNPTPAVAGGQASTIAALLGLGPKGTGPTAPKQQAMSMDEWRKGRAFADYLKGNDLFSGTETGGGFDDDFYQQRQQAYLDYAMPEFNQQYNQTRNNLTFELARRGILGGSAAANKEGQLLRYAGTKRREIADAAVGSANDLRREVENQRSNLVNQVIASGDPSVASSGALTAAANLRAPSAAGPLGNMFSDWTNLYMANQVNKTYASPATSAPGWSFGGGNSSRIVR